MAGGTFRSIGVIVTVLGALVMLGGCAALATKAWYDSMVAQYGQPRRTDDQFLFSLASSAAWPLLLAGIIVGALGLFLVWMGQSRHRRRLERQQGQADAPAGAPPQSS